MSENEDIPISTELEMIGEMWGGDVYMVYRQQRGEWIIRNTTDEGLPVDVERKTARGNTLEEAIENVKQGNYERF